LSSAGTVIVEARRDLLDCGDEAEAMSRKIREQAEKS
jgi:hypothetical protein